MTPSQALSLSTLIVTSKCKYVMHHVMFDPFGSHGNACVSTRSELLIFFWFTVSIKVVVGGE